MIQVKKEIISDWELKRKYVVGKQYYHLDGLLIPPNQGEGYSTPSFIIANYKNETISQSAMFKVNDGIYTCIQMWDNNKEVPLSSLEVRVYNYGGTD